MSRIAIQRDPSGITAPDVYVTDGQVNLLNWLCDNVEHDMFGLHCVVYLNERPLCNTWDYEPDECNKLLDIEIGEFDTVVLVSRPQGIETLIIVAIIAASVVALALTKKPSLPTALEDTSPTSNNQLSESTNGYGLRRAIPDIAGQIVSYPLFAQRSYYEYINGQRVYDEWFYIGVGQYDFSADDVKLSETFITDILGSTATKYNPGDIYPELKRVYVVEDSQGIDLEPTVVSVGSVNGVSGAWDASADELIIGSVAVTKLNPQPGNTLSVNLTGYRVDGQDVITVTVTGDFIVAPSSGGSIFLTTDLDPDDFTVTNGSIVNNDFTPAERYFVLNGTQIDEVWFHLVMPQGIRKGDGTTATVTATMTVEEIDAFGVPTGTTFSAGAEFTGKTQQAQRATFKFTAIDGLTPSRYRAKVVRITDSLGDNALDLLTLEGIASVTYYTPNFGDITALNVRRASDQRVDQGASTKINVLVTRKLRIFDNNTKIYGATYEPTRRFCDYAFYLLHEKMGVAIEDINTDELFGIMDNLSDAQLGYFDYTFDDRNVSARERLETICNAARVRYWNDGLTWSFVRNEAKPVKTLMFNRRNLKAASARYVQKFTLPSDYDGVNLKYVDPDNNTEKTISKRIVAGAVADGEGLNPIEMTLAGCRNLLQAQNRAELEIRQLLLQRVKVTDTALNDAQLIRLGERCDWVDIYDSDIFDGEILAVSGNVYTTSERFTPQDGATYYVYVTDADGNPSNSVIATKRADGNTFGFEATGLTGVFLADGTIQLGSRYFIASNNDLDASTFTLIGRGRPNEKGECQIELVEYNPLVFEED